MSDYPLFPELPEAAGREAVELIEEFKKELTAAASKAISELYTDIVPYIKSDSWTNFRTQMLAGFKNWDNKKIQAEYDFNEIRKQIFIQFREEIMKEMPEELTAENARLKDEIKYLRESIRRG